MSTLLPQVRHLLERAALLYAGTAKGVEVAALRDGLDEPLRVALAGRVKAGKSTLLNALVGDAVAPTDAGECTRIVTWYRRAPAPRAVAHRRGSHRPEPLAFRQVDGTLAVDLGDLDVADVARLVVDWPSSALTGLSLIDTPGLDSVHEEVSARTEAALAPSALAVDAVVYLLRHVHASDVRFLEAFGAGTGVAPFHCIGVLARADEIGAGRADAMTSAHKVAQRYRDDARLRALCATVLPVSGLLAQAGATITEHDVAALRSLVATPALDELLLDASAFAATQDDAGGVAVDQRRALLDRFGICGLRIAVQLLRAGEVRSAGDLAQALIALSGVDELRRVLDTRLAPRRGLLKARSALAALDTVLSDDPAAAGLAAELESLVANAHELAEAALLGTLQQPDLGFSPEEAAAAERLVGGLGDDLMSRLGVDADAAAEERNAVARRELERWQRRAQSPFSTPDAARAARVVVRSCERLARETTVVPDTLKETLT